MGYYRSAYDNSTLGGCLGEIIAIPLGIVCAIMLVAAIHFLDKYGLPGWLRGIIILTLFVVFGYIIYRVNKYFLHDREDESDKKNQKD